MSSAPTPQGAAPARAKLSKLPSLTGLRFFAALLVFFFHSSLSNSPIPPNAPINPFADNTLAALYEKAFVSTGYMGVSFCFVLSGFVLAWSAKPGERMTAFWRRRITKIFPNHLVVSAAVVVLFAGAAITSVSHWLPNLLLIHTFFPQPLINLSLNPPSWSLGSELLFYLLFPLLIIPIRKIRGAGLWVWAALMVAGTIVVQLVSTHLVPDTPKSAITPISDMQFWFGYLFPPGRLFEFVLGAILARLVLSGRWPRQLGIGLSLALVAVGYGATFFVPFQYTFVTATIVPIGLLIAAVADSDVRDRSTWLSSRPMVWLGEVSFGFYLVQGITIFYLRTLLGPATFSTPVALLVIALFFAVSLLAGWLLYRFVEMPAMRRFSRSRRPASAPVPVVIPSQRSGAPERTPASPEQDLV
ncbi:acyltransferase [Streptomyces sp. MJP52]|uniref:acyltransferase family protein n=1 Tax=Streptomyces sp. MJP52 TaxID=2940555 RepID=UPI002475FB14|nr:acyltransferase [Streptomyces sp. MJP52]MDH6223034.1 peptidoglycan/LPS O-acetylase OafA/YrhL [Streptomyces sp. MJP52]MDH6228942.1 peptidoglycan/LPS O-acetylase OafA/YrhL [Streptomyces sp. MJP52]